MVSVPPWSRRPPTVLPEARLTFTKKVQNDFRQEWREKDPEGFAAQEARMLAYQHAKRRRGEPAAGAAGAGGEDARTPPAAAVITDPLLLYLGRNGPSV